MNNYKQITEFRTGMQMNRRHFLKKCAGVAGAFVLSNRALQFRIGRPPNFVFILVDDLGWRDVGYYIGHGYKGSTYYETPNINKLARQGMRFTDAYAACPVCSPTRASIMAGKYPARMHLTDWIHGHVDPNAKLLIPDWTHYMRTEEVTIAEALKAAGYATGHIGKWHLGDDSSYWPYNQGFDVNIGGWKYGSPSGGYFSPYGNPTLPDGPEGEYLTDREGMDDRGIDLRLRHRVPSRTRALSKTGTVRSFCIWHTMPSTLRCRPSRISLTNTRPSHPHLSMIMPPMPQ